MVGLTRSALTQSGLPIQKLRNRENGVTLNAMSRLTTRDAEQVRQGRHPSPTPQTCDSGTVNRLPPRHAQYLQENAILLEAIKENMNAGRIADAVAYQQQLQQNLIYLGTIADEQPDVRTLVFERSDPRGGSQPSRQPAPPRNNEQSAWGSGQRALQLQEPPSGPTSV